MQKQCGVNAKNLKFMVLGFESDKFITVKDNAKAGTNRTRSRPPLVFKTMRFDAPAELRVSHLLLL